MKPSKKKASFSALERYLVYAVYAFTVLFCSVNLFLPMSMIPILSANFYAQTPEPYNWIVTIPPSQPSALTIQARSVVLEISVSASQTIVDGVPVNITAYGCEQGLLNVTNIKSILIGFEGAYWYPLAPNGFEGSAPMAGVTLYPNPSIGENGPFYGIKYFCPAIGPVVTSLPPNFSKFDLSSTVFPPATRYIVFRAPNTYALTMQVAFFTNSTLNYYTYQGNSIVVQSSETLIQANRAYAEGMAVLGGFVFVIYDVLPKLRKKANNETETGAEAKGGAKRPYIG